MMDTAEIKNVEILETGYWSGNKRQLVTLSDLDQMVDNFNKKVVEPFITIDHNDEYTDRVKNFLKVASLGWVSALRRQGEKLIADFKQVPAKIADLIKSGTLKKRSVEFYPKGSPYRTNGKTYENLLTAVTFFGADKPAVSSLRDDFEVLMLAHGEDRPSGEGAVVLREKLQEESSIVKTKLKKAHLEEMASHLEAASDCMKRHMEGEGEGEGEGAESTVAPDPQTESEEVAIAKQLAELAKRLEDMHADLKKIGPPPAKAEGEGEGKAPAKSEGEPEGEGEGEAKIPAKFKDELDSLRKFKAEKEKEAEAALKKEAEAFVGDQIKTGRILPKAADYHIKAYLQAKKEGAEALALYREDVANRPEAALLHEVPTQFSAKDGEAPTGKKPTEFKSTDDLEKEVRAVMKADKCSWAEADQKVWDREKEH
jgi:hypothetical protein